jgi:hypothetical protein
VSEWPDLTQEEEGELTQAQSEARLKGLMREYHALNREFCVAHDACRATTKVLEVARELMEKASRRVDHAYHVHKRAIEDAVYNEQREEPKDDRIQW